MLTLHSPYQRCSGPTGPSTSAGAAGSTGASAAVWPGVVLSAYTEIVDTNDQWPTWSARAESACRAWLTWRVTSTTASKPASASGTSASGSSRSAATNRAPAGTAPDTPRAAQVTS